MKYYYLVSIFPNGQSYKGGSMATFKSAQRLLATTMKIINPLVEGVVIQVVEEDTDGDKAVIEMAARDEKGFHRMEELKEIVV